VERAATINALGDVRDALEWCPRQGALHQHEPGPGTVYRSTCLPVEGDVWPEYYPLEAMCETCGQPVRCDSRSAGWELKQ
jgi:hypothetical protein